MSPSWMQRTKKHIPENAGAQFLKSQTINFENVQSPYIRLNPTATTKAASNTNHVNLKSNFIRNKIQSQFKSVSMANRNSRFEQNRVYLFDKENVPKPQKAI